MDTPLKEIYHAYNQYNMTYEENRSDVAKSFCKNLNIELPNEAWNKTIHIEPIVLKMNMIVYSIDTHSLNFLPMIRIKSL